MSGTMLRVNIAPFRTPYLIIITCEGAIVANKKSHFQPSVNKGHKSGNIGRFSCNHFPILEKRFTHSQSNGRFQKRYQALRRSATRRTFELRRGLEYIRPRSRFYGCYFFAPKTKHSATSRPTYHMPWFMASCKFVTERSIF